MPSTIAPGITSPTAVVPAPNSRNAAPTPTMMSGQATTREPGGRNDPTMTRTPRRIAIPPAATMATLFLVHADDHRPSAGPCQRTPGSLTPP